MAINYHSPLSFEIVKLMQCCACSESFQISDRENSFGAKAPILLQCKHAACVTCVKKSDRSMILCRLCKIPKNESLRENPTYHAHLLSHLAVVQKCRQPAVKLKVEAAQPLPVPSTDICCDCGGCADVWCKQCGNKMCLQCWNKVHTLTESNALKSHQNTKLVPNDNRTCVDHPSRAYELFCCDCNKPICSLCHMLNLHTNHNLKTLNARNEELREDLSSAIKVGESFVRSMLHTLKIIQFEKNPTRPKMANVEKLREVVNFFARLHGSLQLQEEKALQMLADASDKTNRDAAQLEVNVLSQIKECQALLERAKLAMEDSESDVNGPDTLCRLLKFGDSPCHLLKSDDVSSASMFELKESVFSELEKLVVMNIEEKPCFTLVTADQIPEGAEDPTSKLLTALMPPPSLEELEIASSASSSVFGRNSSVRSDSSFSDRPVSSQRNATSGAKKPRPKVQKPSSQPVVSNLKLTTGVSVPVTVTHIVNPSEFYVVLRTDIPRIEHMQQQAHFYGENRSIHPNKIELGQQILIIDNNMMWHRAEVECWDESSITARLIDVGNSTIVKRSCVKVLPKRHAFWNDPPFAIRCSIHNISPILGEWTSAASIFMKNYLTKRPEPRVSLQVMAQAEGYLKVDLSVCTTSHMVQEVVSMRDFLLFHQHGVVVHAGEPENPRSIHRQPVLYYAQRNRYQPSDFQASVSFVVSPSHFYLQKTDEGHFLRDITKRLEAEYKRQNDDLMIVSPVNNMPCAVLDPETKQWRRGKIVMKKEQMVELVDIGGWIPLQPKAVRKILPMHLRYPPCAILASLADIECPGASWSDDAVEYFRSLTENITVGVRAICQQDNRLIVVLKNFRSGLIINQQLIDFGDAVPGGVSSNKAPEDEPISTFRKQRNGKLWYDPTKKKRGVPPVAPVAPRQRQEQEEEQVQGQDQSQIIQTTQDTHALKNGTEVAIIKPSSPTLIYFAFADYSTKITEISRALCDALSGSLPDVDASWAVGDKCAFYSKKFRQWRRGEVKAVLFLTDDSAGNDFEILSLDTMIEETVAAINIRELPTEMKTEQIVYKAHLAGVQPVGADWGTLALDFIGEVFTNAESVFLVSKDDLTSESVAAEIFIRETVFAGPFAPAKVEHTSVNKQLVKKGFASSSENYAFGTFPSIATVKLPTLPVDSDALAHEATSVPAVTPPPNVPSVTKDWLPCVPLAKKSRLIGKITHVDERGIMYFYELETDHALLEGMTEGLSNAYKDSKPNPQDSYWSEGQICTARYHSDDRWYRGRIVKTGVGKNKRSYLVLFVDYGNLEICPATDLRKGVLYLDTPIYGHSCYISDIRPADGKTFCYKGINYFHVICVPRDFIIDVLDYEKEPFPARLTSLTTVKDRFQELVDEKYAIRRTGPYKMCERDFSGSDAWLEITDSESETTADSTSSLTRSPAVSHVPAPIPHPLANGDQEEDVITSPITTDSEEMIVAAIEDSENTNATQAPKKSWTDLILEEEKIIKWCKNIWSGEILKIPMDVNFLTISLECAADDILMARLHCVAAPTAPLPEDLMVLLQSAVAMEREIRIGGWEMMAVDEPEVGLACIASYDNIHRRGVILAVHSNCTADVSFFDYGYRSLLPFEAIRVGKEEWFKIPALAMPMKLNKWSGPFPEPVHKLIMTRDALTTAAIVKREKEFLVVELLTEPTGRCIYEADIRDSRDNEALNASRDSCDSNALDASAADPIAPAPEPNADLDPFAPAPEPEFDQIRGQTHRPGRGQPKSRKRRH